ncbi:MAG: energy transducer TonB [Litorimonas sp.]
MPRHAAAIAGGGAATIALLALMTGLIAEEFTPMDTVELGVFEINPVAEDISVLVERTPPELPDRIDVPPPPPQVDIPATVQPSEPIVGLAQPVIELTPTIALPTDFTPAIQDGNVTPLVRIPPVMPPRATRSGHCQIGFDIGPDGRPFNVQALSCSQALFSRSAVRSVEKWTYRPEIRDGLAVTRTGLKTKISFVLSDERGQVIPE